MKCLNIKEEENKNKRLGPFVALAVKNTMQKQLPIKLMLVSLARYGQEKTSVKFAILYLH